MVRRADVIRTCVGCRNRASASELLRVVANPETPATGVRLVPDPARKLPGRGAHVHPAPECLEQARRRRAFKRALRLSSEPDLTAVADFLA
ncbi:YlxR family protein [Stackebrandtia nassauensis]|uniref:YlxR family protein n=1 Tax=Stackebrandtia nassauensis TaxID=283811 RepID=UPI00030D29B4|nr:YlxR family protein [Stackebrandtia nassauensis]